MFSALWCYQLPCIPCGPSLPGPNSYTFSFFFSHFRQSRKKRVMWPLNLQVVSRETCFIHRSKSCPPFLKHSVKFLLCLLADTEARNAQLERELDAYQKSLKYEWAFFFLMKRRVLKKSSGKCLTWKQSVLYADAS